MEIEIKRLSKQVELLQICVGATRRIMRSKQTNNHHSLSSHQSFFAGRQNSDSK
jgi:hypothetical protein